MSVTEDNEKKDMVKYRNEFNLTDLNSLDKIEQDILFTICSRFTHLKKEQILMTFDELREKAFLSERRYDYGENIAKLQSLGEKITKIQFTITNGDDVKTMALFPTLSANVGTKEIFVRINPDFTTYLYDIPEKIGFSLYELQQFIFLKSKYSKTLFRFLVQNFTGKWTIGIDELREKLGFPDSYTPGKVIQRIKEIIPELENTDYFSNIEVDYTTKNVQGRPIKDVIFTYKVNDLKRLEAAGQTTFDFSEYQPVTTSETKREINVSENSAEVFYTNKIIETLVKCPKCDGRIVMRQVTGEGENKGKWYKKCENNGLKGHTCDYFEWIDPPKSKNE